MGDKGHKYPVKDAQDFLFYFVQLLNEFEVI